MELAESGVGYHWDGLFVGASQFYKANGVLVKFGFFLWPFCSD